MLLNKNKKPCFKTKMLISVFKIFKVFANLHKFIDLNALRINESYWLLLVEVVLAIIAKFIIRWDDVPNVAYDFINFVKSLIENVWIVQMIRRSYHVLFVYKVMKNIKDSYLNK